MKYSNKEDFKRDVIELLNKIKANVQENDNVLTATLKTSFSCSALGSMHLLNGSSTSKDITINLDNYDKVNEGNLEEQYLNKCRIYVLTGYRKNLDEAQEVKSFLNEKMDEMINKPSVQLDLVTAELSKLRNNLKKWNGTDDVATIADGIDLKSAVSTAMLVNKVADKLLGKNSRIPTSVGNNPTVELLDSANTQGGGGQPEDTKKLRKPRNQSNQLGENLNASSNSNVEMNASTVAPLVGANTLGGGGQNEEIVNTSVTIPEVTAQKRALNASILNVFKLKNTENTDVNASTVAPLDSANTQGGGGQPEDTKKLRKPRNQSNQSGENLNASSNSNVEMNASTVAPLVGANPQGGGGQSTEPPKRKPRNQSNQLVVDSNAISNLSEQRIFKDSASNSPSSQNINLDNLKELCIKPFADYKQSKIDQGRWETNVDQGKKDILENVKEGISKATSIEQIKDAIDTVISSAQTKPSSVLGGIFQTVKNTFASPGELHTAAQEAKKIFDEQKDKVQSSENAFSNKQGTI